MGLGGSGGAGDVSSDVNATQSGPAAVTRINADGVLAQSVAGGGSGGLNVSGSLALGQGFSAAIGVPQR